MKAIDGKDLNVLDDYGTKDISTINISVNTGDTVRHITLPIDVIMECLVANRDEPKDRYLRDIAQLLEQEKTKVQVMTIQALTMEANPIYDSGALDYALSCLQEQGSFEAYAKWLKTQPVASFENKDDWTIDNSTITYTDPDGEKEHYDVTGLITLDSGETILHSIEAGMSYFFKVYDNKRIHTLYVD